MKKKFRNLLVFIWKNGLATIRKSWHSCVYYPIFRTTEPEIKKVLDKVRWLLFRFSLKRIAKSNPGLDRMWGVLEGKFIKTRDLNSSLLSAFVKVSLERAWQGPQKTPREDETCAVSIALPKTCALVYDRVWGSSCWDVPESIRFGGTTDLEKSFWLFMWSFIESQLRSPTEYRDHVDGLDSAGVRHFTEKERRVLDNIGSVVGHLCRKIVICERPKKAQSYSDFIYNVAYRAFRGDFLDELEEYEKTPHLDTADAFARVLAMEHKAQHGMSVVPVYHSRNTETLLYRPGKTSVLIATLENLEVVDENELEWEQVLEFKKDSETLRKYKRLIHWLDRDLVGKSVEQITEIMEEKLEDYRSALKRHALKTKVGLLQAAFDWRALTAGGVVASAAKNPLIGALTTGAMAIGKVSLQLTHVKLEYDAKKKETLPEIHWVYDIPRKFK